MLCDNMLRFFIKVYWPTIFKMWKLSNEGWKNVEVVITLFTIKCQKIFKYGIYLWIYNAYVLFLKIFWILLSIL